MPAPRRIRATPARSLSPNASPRRSALARCASLARRLPWLDERPAESLAGFLAFALSVCQMPRPDGSLGRSLELAFPAGSLPSSEAKAAVAAARAARAIGCPRIRASDAEAERACELAPLLLGGSLWAGDPLLAGLARRALALAWVHACADRALGAPTSPRGPRLRALLALETALAAACGLDPETPAPPLTAALKALGVGSAAAWPCAQAARERLALSERGALDAFCPAQAPSRRPLAL